MRGLGRGVFGAASAAVAAVLLAVLIFGVSSAVADPPTFDPASDQTLEATSSAGAVATFSVTATDLDNPPALVVCDHNSGDVFPIGSTQVSCTATDTVTSEVSGPQVVLTITVHDTTGPDITTPGTITTEATGAGGATVTYAASASDLVAGSVTPDCAPASGSLFALGTTNVTCTASDGTNSSSANFDVVVQDTTAPVLSGVSSDISAPATGPGGAAVSFPSPTATDTVDPSPAVTCTPASGSTFALGTTQVSCTATDSSSNTSSPGTFNVTVTDGVKPTLGNMPGNITVPATSGAGAVVNYSLPTASDNVDTNPSVNCSPGSGSTFPLGTTTVTCTATDTSGNQDSNSFTITVADTTGPSMSGPGNQTVEATGPGGATVSFSVSASDSVDPSPSVTCAPASGSTFALGATTVNCTGRDAANNSTPLSFTVTVVDTTAPTFSNVPSPPTVEANGASGSAVGYTLPTAFDLVSGAVPVSCSPASGSLFPIGTTEVDCAAHDSRANTRHVQFSIRVADRTPPVISAPASLSLYATTPTGIPTSDPSVADAARYITAADNIDPHPVITSDMPEFLPLGHTLVHFFASDRYGNGSGVNMDVNVIPRPATGPVTPLPVPDVAPPGNVSNLTARPGNASVTLSWKLPADRDLDHVVAYRSDPTASELGTPEYTGTGTKFTDRGLENDKQYRYVVVTFDKAGNRSVGLAILATPRVLKLLRPLDGAAVKKAPVLVWLAAAEADYYNVQLFRDSAKSLAGFDVANAKKILSVWPTRTRLVLKAQWKFEGHKYRLTKGTYRWFVWPGFGARSQNNYGPLLGESTFRVTR